LRVADQACIFAAGDCVRVPNFSGGIVLSTASFAMRQGEHRVKALLVELLGDTPRAYTSLQLGHVVSLGPCRAVGDPLGVPISGRLASFLNTVIEKWYLTTLE